MCRNESCVLFISENVHGCEKEKSTHLRHFTLFTIMHSYLSNIIKQTNNVVGWFENFFKIEKKNLLIFKFHQTITFIYWYNSVKFWRSIHNEMLIKLHINITESKREKKRFTISKTIWLFSKNSNKFFLDIYI